MDKQRTPFRESLRMMAVQSPVIGEVGKLIRANPGTISLGQGVVYYGPPEAAMERLHRFLADPQNHCYGPAEGDPKLVELINGKLWVENNIRCSNDYRVVVTAGANMGFLNAVETF